MRYYGLAGKAALKSRFAAPISASDTASCNDHALRLLCCGLYTDQLSSGVSSVEGKALALPQVGLPNFLQAEGLLYGAKASGHGFTVASEIEWQEVSTV